MNLDDGLRKTPDHNQYGKLDANEIFLSKSYQAKIKEKETELGKPLSYGRKFSMGVIHAMEGTKMKLNRFANKLKHGEYINNKEQLKQLDASIDELNQHLGNQVNDKDPRKITKEKSQNIEQSIRRIGTALKRLETMGADTKKVEETRAALDQVNSLLGDQRAREEMRLGQIWSQKTSLHPLDESATKVFEQVSTNLNKIEILRSESLERTLSLFLKKSVNDLDTIRLDIHTAQKDMRAGVLGSADRLLTAIDQYYALIDSGIEEDLGEHPDPMGMDTHSYVVENLKGDEFPDDNKKFEELKTSLKDTAASEKEPLESVKKIDKELWETLKTSGDTVSQLVQKGDFIGAYDLQEKIDEATSGMERLPDSLTQETAKLFQDDRAQRQAIIIDYNNRGGASIQYDENTPPLDKAITLDRLKGKRAAEFANMARNAHIDLVYGLFQSKQTEIETEKNKYSQDLQLKEKWLSELRDPREKLPLTKEIKMLKTLLVSLDKQMTELFKHRAPTKRQRLTRSLSPISPEKATNAQLLSWGGEVNSPISEKLLVSIDSQKASLKKQQNEFQTFSTTTALYAHITNYKAEAAAFGILVDGDWKPKRDNETRAEYLNKITPYLQAVDEAIAEGATLDQKETLQYYRSEITRLCVEYEAEGNLESSED